MVVGHGIGLTKSASLRQAAMLHDLGYHVIMFDHRNHGGSGADSSSRNLAERFGADIEACLQLAAETWPEAGPPIVWGFSFSTFPTLYSLRHLTTPPIRAIICDSGPGHDLHRLLTGFLRGGGVPAPRFINHVVRRTRVASAFAHAAVDMLGATWPPDPALPVISTTPMLFLTGSDDHIIEPAQVRAVATLYPSAKIIEYPGQHLRGLTEAPKIYSDAVAAFLENLTGELPAATKPPRTSSPQRESPRRQGS